MNDPKASGNRRVVRGKSRMPENSVFYEKVLPALLVLLALIMVALILFAGAVILGQVPFR